MNDPSKPKWTSKFHNVRYHDMDKAAEFRRKVAFGLPALILCVFSLGLISLAGAAFGTPDVAGAQLATLPFMAGMMLHDPADPDNPGAGGGLSNEEFQTKALEKLDAMKTAQTESLDEHSKETKKALEELNEATKTFEGLGSQVKAFEVALKKVQLGMETQRKEVYGDPREQILRSAEKRGIFAALIHKTVSQVSQGGHAVPDQYKDILKALSDAASPGSTFVDDELHSDVYDLLSRYGIWSSFDVKPVSKKSNKVLTQTARPIALAYGPGITIAEDTNKAGVSVAFDTVGIKVLLTIANELLDDAEIDLVGNVLDDFVEAVNYRADFFCLQADGTNDGTNGAMTGIFEGGTATTAAAGNTTMEDLELEDVTGVLLGAPEALLQRSPQWWLHPHILIRMLHIKDANGRPIFLNALEAPAGGKLGTLLGHPINLAAAAPSANTAGSAVAAFGDPKGMVAAMQRMFSLETSKDAAFEDDSTVFRGTERFANKIRSAEAFSILTLAAS